MQSLLSIAMVVTLGIHALLGCCKAHAHPCANCQQVKSTAVAHKGCCKHRQASSRSQAPAAPCKCKGECKGVCTYLPPEKVSVDASPFATPFDFVAVVPMLADGHLGAASCWENASETPQLDPPLRLHLVHQILLI